MWLKAIVLAPAIPAAVLLVARLRKRKPARRRATAPSRPTPQAAEA
jgi:hypothetical protein